MSDYTREDMARAWDEGWLGNDDRVRSFDNPYRCPCPAHTDAEADCTCACPLYTHEGDTSDDGFSR